MERGVRTLTWSRPPHSPFAQGPIAILAPLTGLAAKAIVATSAMSGRPAQVAGSPRETDRRGAVVGPARYALISVFGEGVTFAIDCRKASDRTTSLRNRRAARSQTRPVLHARTDFIASRSTAKETEFPARRAMTWRLEQFLDQFRSSLVRPSPLPGCRRSGGRRISPLRTLHAGPRRASLGGRDGYGGPDDNFI